MIELSVVVSVYENDNPQEFLKAIDSIFDQSYAPAEVIICADGPLSDDLEDVVSELGTRSIVTILRLERNIGLGGSRHYAIMNSNGKYVAVMDADDVSTHDRFKLQIEAHRAAQIDVVGGYIKEFSENGKTRIRDVPLRHDDIFKRGKYRSPVNHVTVMFKRDSYMSSGGYDAIRGVEDYDLFHRMLVGGYKFKNISEILVEVKFDNEVMVRRRGYTYLKCWLKLLFSMYQSGYLNLFQLIGLSCVHSAVKLSPAFVTPLIYKLIRS